MKASTFSLFKPNPGAAGFTLVEILIGIGLFSLLGTISMRFFIHMTRGQQKLSQQAILQMETRRAFDQTLSQIRTGSDIIRPVTGETSPYLIFRDLVNHITILYLEPDREESERLKQPIYRLISYKSDLSGTYDAAREKVLHGSMKELRFSSLSPGSIQINATVVGDADEYQFLSHVGLLNIGGLK